VFLKVGNRVGNVRIIQKKKGLRFSLSPCFSSGGGEWIRTTDLRVMSPMMTARYAHLRDESLRRASDLAGEIINNIKGDAEEENPLTNQG
jgi:hypothetical protein